MSEVAFEESESSVCVLYVDTFYSVYCPPCWRLIARSLITYYWQAAPWIRCASHFKVH